MQLSSSSCFPHSSVSKSSAYNAGDLVQSLGQEDTLEKEVATHSSILAWRIPWTEEPGRLLSMGSQESDNDLATKPPPPPCRWISSRCYSHIWNIHNWTVFSQLMVLRTAVNLKATLISWGNFRTENQSRDVTRPYACTHAKSLQLCPTLCDPVDCSLLGSSVHRISQARYWSRLPFSPPGDLPHPGNKPTSSALARGFFITSTTWEVPHVLIISAKGNNQTKLSLATGLPPSHHVLAGRQKTLSCCPLM